jgi:fused signal recognition particle receptor
MIKWFKRKKKTAAEPPDEETVVEVPSEEPSDELWDEPSEVEGADDAGDAAQPSWEETAEMEEPGGAEPPEDELLEAEFPEEEHPDEELAEESMSDLEQPAAREKGRFFKKLRERLHKTREQFVERVDRLVLGKKTIDLDLLDELEEVLITSDLGVRTTQLLLEKITDRIKRKELSDPAKLHTQLREEIKAILSVETAPFDPRSHRPFVIMVIGVNGVGKTTTIGKLAHQLKREGLEVMLVAADTFRAAAVEQLVLWGERVHAPVIRQKSGSDPSAVAFDALDAAVARDVDVLIIDTAGRMHTKVNLMEELKKVHRVVSKKMESAPHEILLVLDSTTGQNALSQARLFKEGIGVTGLVLTKLDGTAKGGIIVAISEELQLPVRYIGIGESMEDLRPFDPDEFTKALF